MSDEKYPSSDVTNELPVSTIMQLLAGKTSAHLRDDVYIACSSSLGSMTGSYVLLASCFLPSRARSTP